MEKFSISRIHTQLGIFRIEGFWQPQRTYMPTDIITNNSANIPAHISVDAIAIMGTDGWIELIPHDKKVVKLINELAGELHQHLLTKTTST
jgi:hypothetical protein